MNTYKKPGIPLDMAIEFQKKMIYAMRTADITVETLAKSCDLATSTVDWILRRPDHRVTMIQYLGLINALNSFCISKITALYGTCKFIEDVDLDNDLTKYLKASKVINELMEHYEEWTKRS